MATIRKRTMQHSFMRGPQGALRQMKPRGSIPRTKHTVVTALLYGADIVPKLSGLEVEKQV